MIRRILVALCILHLSGTCNPAGCRELVMSTFDTRTRVLSNAEAVVVEAYQRLGYSLKITTYPGERALTEANVGNVDGEVFRVANIEKRYANLIRIPVPITAVDVVVFTKDTVFDVTGWESLAPYAVGYRRGVKAVEHNMPDDIRLYPVSTYEQVFQMLDSGRVDIVISSRTVGLEVVRKLELEGVKVLEPPLVRKDLFHYLHKKNKDLVAPLTRVLQEMSQQGLCPRW